MCPWVLTRTPSRHSLTPTSLTIGTNQEEQADAARAALRIVVEPQPKYDRHVFLLVLQLARRDDIKEGSAAGDAGETVPESESEIEDDFNERGMYGLGGPLRGGLSI